MRGWLKKLVSAWQAWANAYRSWLCSRSHHHVISWDTKEDRSMTVLYVQCTVDGCRRRSSGVSLVHPVLTPATRPVGWWRGRPNTYINHHDPEIEVVRRLVPRLKLQRGAFARPTQDNLQERNG